jgi:predicted O-methyltransferase YrrM
MTAVGALDGPAVAGLLDRLHAQSAAQEAETRAWFSERAKKGELSWDGLDAASHRYMADKLVALEPDKARFAHLMVKALRATRVVEVGGSHGVSTLYLAAAVRDNGGGVVISTEWEAAKCAAARANAAEAGLSDLIDLREGDLRETLKLIEGPVDLVLMDIWTEMARPAIELVGPHLRPGAVVLADNTGGVFREPYRHFFAYVEDPANRMTSMTLPFSGGLELVVKG